MKAVLHITGSYVFDLDFNVENPEMKKLIESLMALQLKDSIEKTGAEQVNVTMKITPLTEAIKTN